MLPSEILFQVGPCLNFMPARVRINTDQCFRDLLQQVYEQQMAIIPYESTPFDRIARQALWPASTRFASIFQFQNIPDQENDENKSSTDSTWTIAGNATYGGGLLQDGACWLMAWPVAEDRAAFRFTFSAETLSLSRAKSILDLFFKILHAMNDNLEDTISSALSIPIDDGLLEQEGNPSPSQNANHHHQSHSLSISPHFRTVLARLEAIWTHVLHPPPESPHQKIDQAPSVGRKDSFFDLGGDSISAAEVASLCVRAGFDLKLQEIIEFPTLALQTLLISGQIHRPARDPPKLHFSPNHKFN
jgi:Condensation domain/Phosphopantetheine attachment site